MPIKLFCIALVIVGRISLSVDLGHLALLNHAEISKRYIQSVRLPTAQTSKIVYGNPQIGYFRTPLGSNNSVHLIPPTYRSSIEFYDEQKRFLKKIRFKDPTPKLFQEAIDHTLKKGKLSSRYFLLSGMFPQKDGSRNLYLYIANMLGEVVWIHIPKNAIEPFGRTGKAGKVIAKKLSNGRYGVMLDRHESYFEVVDYRGQTLQQFASLKTLPKTFMHHDFIFNEPDELITFGYEHGYIRHPLHVTRPPQHFLGNTIQSSSLSKLRTKILWKGFNFFNPYLTKDWDWSHSRTAPDGYWTGEGSKKAHYDLLHMNSIVHEPGQGYLVSIRNLSKVIFLDEAMKKVIWSIGLSEENTHPFKTKAARFRYQHHAE